MRKTEQIEKEKGGMGRKREGCEREKTSGNSVSMSTIKSEPRRVKK
jgi:hypothetical protein